MSRILLAYGSLLLVAFTLTGQHLKRAVVPLHAADPAIRMMMRSYHIYALLGALLVLCAGMLEAPNGWRKKVLGVGQILVALAATAFLAGYILDYGHGLDGRSMAFPGSVLALVGVSSLFVARYPFK